MLQQHVEMKLAIAIQLLVNMGKLVLSLAEYAIHIAFKTVDEFKMYLPIKISKRLNF